VKILVTGGAGFIGSHIADRLILDKHEVWVLDDLSTGKKENINRQARFIEMDIAEPSLKDAMKGAEPETVFHCAAQIDVRKSIADPIADAKSNILGTINLMEACRSWKTRKVIYSSSGGTVYGNVERAATEDFPMLPLSPYAVSKLTAENYLRCYSEWHGIKYTVLRYANVYGPRQNPFGEAGVVAIFSRNMLRGENAVLYGFGTMVRDYVYVGDVVDANVLSIQKGDGEILNIGTAKPTTVKELFDTIAGLLSFKGNPDMKPGRDGELKSNFLSYDRARRILGWGPKVSLKEGLRITTDWFKERLA
jgi:UDP-glucose 4-epimerase